MKIKAGTIILIWLSFFLVANGFSQTANIVYFNTEHGLPQSSIYGVVQDKLGNIWVGTIGGVSKYNGIVFKNYSRRNGLSENWVTSVFVDKVGGLWFGHWAGGISKYNPELDSMEIIQPGNLTVTKPISKIFQDSEGFIWFMTEGSGVIRFDGKKSFEAFSTKDGLSSNLVNCAIESEPGQVWFGTEEGLSKWSKGEFTNYTSRNGFEARGITALLSDSSGKIWVGTRELGVMVYGSTANLTQPIQKYNVSKGLNSNFCTTLKEDRDHFVWIGTNSGGVSKVSPVDPSMVRIITTDEGLSSNKILSLYQDLEGSMWIGSYVGLNQYKPDVFQTFGHSDGLMNSLIWSIAKTKSGMYFLGTEGGLIKFDPTQISKEKRFVGISKTLGSPNPNVSFVLTDRNQMVWFSRWGNGVGRYNPENGKTDYFGEKEGLTDLKIYGMAEDTSFGLWLGTSKHGAIRYDLKTGKMESFTSQDGLGSDRIFTIFRDSHQNLWFGTLGGYITRYDGNSFKTFSEKNGLFHSFILSITEDESGKIWVGTYGGGIYVYDGKSFSHVEASEKLGSDTPFLLQGDGHQVWIGTSLGIDKYNLKEKSISHFGKEEGFLGIEVNPNAVLKDDDGSIWFGTIGGLIKYDPKFDRKNLSEPQLHITGFKILFKDVNVDNLPKDETYKTVLSYAQNSLTFDFIGISFINPKKVKYLYKLEGLHKDWISEPTYINSVTFQNIPPGDYTFLLKASNNDGVWNSEPIRFSFSIKPPFYQTIWIYLLYMLVIVLFVFGVIKGRTKMILREKLVLETKVKEKDLEVSHHKMEMEETLRVATRLLQPEGSQESGISSDSFFVVGHTSNTIKGNRAWASKSGNSIALAMVDFKKQEIHEAVLAVAGNHWLNKVFVQMKIHSPKEMLDLWVHDIFPKHNYEIGVSLVPEMGILVVNFESKLVEFSGVNLSMAHVSLAGGKKEVKWLDGNTFNMGSLGNDEKIIPVKHQATALEGDCFYIFTAGMKERLCGQELNKDSLNKLEEIMFEICSRNLKEQESYVRRVMDETIGNSSHAMMMGIKI